MSKIPKDKEFNDFLEQIKKEQKTIDINWFKNVFNHETPDEMLRYLHSLETIYDYNKATYLIEETFTYFGNEVKIMSEVNKKNEGRKVLNIDNNILNFTLKERKSGHGFNILTPNQILRRSPINLPQLKAGNNSEKLKNKVRQLLYSLYRSKKLTKQIYKNLIDII